MNDKSVEEEILEKGLTAPRVTLERINDLCSNLFAKYERYGTSTFCHGFLYDEFYVATGHAACVSMENFDEGLGRRIAFENMVKAARDELWKLEGYSLYKELNNV